MILVLVIVGTVVGLSIHFIEPIMTEPITTEPITTEPITIDFTTEPITTEPIIYITFYPPTIGPNLTKEFALEEAILILNTYGSSNVPMVLTSTGESSCLDCVSMAQCHQGKNPKTNN